MASESGTSAVTGWINTSLIQKVVTKYALDYFPAMQFVRIEPIQPGTKTAAFSKITKQTALSGTITELSGLSNTVFQTANVTAAIAEVGILRQFTKLVERTNMLGPQGLLDANLEDSINMCLEKFETDIWAQWLNASTTVGTSGQVYTVANFSSALAQHTINKSRGNIVAMLTATQTKNLRNEVVGSTAAVMAAGQGNGLMQQTVTAGYAGVFMGCPVYTNNLAASTGADKVGAHIIDGVQNPEYSATGVALGWMPEVSMLNQPQFSGGTQVAVTMAYGMVEIQDAFYVGDQTIA